MKNTKHNTLQDLLDALRIAQVEANKIDIKIEEVVGDLSALPTFGGETPTDTEGIFSWDADNYLVQDNGQTGWELVARSDWYGYY